MAAKKLSAKQAAFVREYLVDLNGTQAAVRAGYSVRTANRMASENLSKPVIQSAIFSAMQERAQRTEIDQDDIVRSLDHWRQMDIRRLLDWQTDDQGIYRIQLKHPADIDALDARAIQSIKLLKGGVIEVKLVDKLKAKAMLMKHLGIDTPSEGEGDSGSDLPEEVETLEDARNVLDFHAGRPIARSKERGGSR